MPAFSFSVAQKLKNKKKYKVISDAKILQKDCIGVVHIDDNFNFYVSYNGVQYFIHPDSYETKGCKIIYSKRLLDNRRFRLIRDPFYGFPAVKGYLPFTAGCIVKGNIVINQIIKQEFFKIKSVADCSFDNEESMKAARHFREKMKK